MAQAGSGLGIQHALLWALFNWLVAPNLGFLRVHVCVGLNVCVCALCVEQ